MKIKEKEFEDIIEELKVLAVQLGATIRFEKGDFKGGYCLLKDSKVIVINKLANTQRKAMILATALKELGIDQIYITPKVRELIDEMFDEK
ncbi:MAG: hypothetical protein Q8N03_11090 [Ignavibacteria bacterium]|jgi:hypothetical protein|nr:hypothetical protein [Ignavibacteria bacterium]MDP3830294.1 hypothetical protein [Ignavibacteriaceae bacterium]